MKVAGQIAFLMLALPAPLLAEVDVSEWLCESCPFEDGYRADFEAGTTYVSDEDIRYGNATGYDSDGVFLNVDGEGSYTRNGYRQSWRLEDLGLDSRVVSIDGGKQGLYGYWFEYSELPSRVFGTTQTIFDYSAGALSLPAAWVPASTTAGFTELGNSLKTRTIESDRQTAGLGGRWLASDAIEVYADYSRQTRDGIDIKSGAGFTQASLLPRRIDYATDQADVGIRWHTGSGSLTLAYYGSYFDNKNSALSWQTPFTASPGASELALAEEPDNTYQQLSLSGAYHADFWDSVLAFSLSAGRGEQDESFLDYTTNPDIITAALPRNSLQGEVDSSNYAVTLTTRPIKRLRIKLSYRYDDRDNTTAIDDWSRVITDVFPSGEVQQNIAYSFTRTRLAAVADVKILDSLRVSAGYDRNELDRDFQEVAEQTEDSGWGQVRWRPVSWFELRGRGGASKRDINRYDEDVAVSYGQNPLMRKYNLAYRYREFGELSASLSPTSMPVSFTATLFTAEDSYTRSKLGLTDSDETRYSVDLSWTISEAVSTYLMFGSEAVEAVQLGSANFSTPDWRAAHEDEFDHWGIGMRWRQPEGNFQFRLDYSNGEGDTDILVNRSGLASALPKLTSSLDSLRAEMAWRWSEKLDLTLDVRFESFLTDDWALADVAPDTLPTVLTLGASPYDYDVWALGIGFRYYMGNRNTELAN
jgi:MtrB/PioB family decaheme-associated outer membrane protein